MFVVTLPEGLLVFESRFDETLDDYTPDYSVYYVPCSEAHILHGSWDGLVTGTERLGEVPVAEVEFDQTRRHQVSTRVVERFANRITNSS